VFLLDEKIDRRSRRRVTGFLAQLGDDEFPLTMLLQRGDLSSS